MAGSIGWLISNLYLSSLLLHTTSISAADFEPSHRLLSVSCHAIGTARVIEVKVRGERGIRSSDGSEGKVVVCDQHGDLI